MKPLLLDLFCGAGGCSKGYWQAGFQVVGVDNRQQPNYQFTFVPQDALVVLRELVASQGGRFDAIHASPPCQAHSKALKIMGGDHDDLVEATRDLLIETGLPYVIENVKGAPLRNPQLLEGQMFGLNTHRPRLFETNWPLEVPVLRPPPPRQAKMGRKPKEGEAIQVVGHFSDIEAAKKAMGIDWMSQRELAQAIPPTYTEFIGKQLMQVVVGETTQVGAEAA